MRKSYQRITGVVFIRPSRADIAAVEDRLALLASWLDGEPALIRQAALELVEWVAGGRPETMPEVESAFVEAQAVLDRDESPEARASTSETYASAWRHRLERP